MFQSIGDLEYMACSHIALTRHAQLVSLKLLPALLGGPSSREARPQLKQHKQTMSAV